MSKEIIKRSYYLSKLESFINKDLIKVFVGQRCVGKSFLLRMTRDHIAKNTDDPHIIFIDKEQYEFDFIHDYHQLIKFVELKMAKNKKNYLFIDEIQEIKQFEKALRHFQNKELADIYCTGSNAMMLSGDLATLLSGRYIHINVHALSFKEFLEFHDLESNQDSLNKYLKWGGLPFLKNLAQQDEVVFDYLKNLVSSIVYKDVLYRYKVRNVDFFDSLIHYLASNTGNLITAKRISEYLKSQRVDISPKVVLNYLDYLQNAFLVHKVKRVDIQSKKVFEINNKHFFEDWGLRNSLVGLNHFSVPDILENVVYAHLKHLDFNVSIGVLKNLEVDFIAEKSGITMYIQVAYLIADNKVKEREFGNLLLIKDNYPKLVVSLDTHIISDYKGVQHMNLLEFLNNESFK